MSAVPARGTTAQQRPRRSHHKRHRRAPEQTEPGDADEPEEKRPKVNPIFLWASQQEQRIVEVRCEDYDKRNRIKLTKTAQGWRSIPRTTVIPTTTTPVTGTSYQNGERPTEATRHRHHRGHRHHEHRSTKPPSETLRRPGVDRSLLLLQPRVVLQQLRPSQLPGSSVLASEDRGDQSRGDDALEVLDDTAASPAIAAMAADTPTADLPDSPNRPHRGQPSETAPSPPPEVPNRPHCLQQSGFTDEEADIDGADSGVEDSRTDGWSISLPSPAPTTDSLENDATSSSRILNALRNTPGLSVSVATLDGNQDATSVTQENLTESAAPWQRRPPPGLLISAPRSGESPVKSPAPALMSGLSISIPSYRYRPRSGGNPTSARKLDPDSPESTFGLAVPGTIYPKVEPEDLDDSRSQSIVVQASPQPSGIPCSPAAGARPASAYLERLLPSPPCSVSCSEDARNDLTLKGILASPSQHHRQHAPTSHLTPETNNNDNSASLELESPGHPASELRELLRVSGHLIPDPLLVPRDFLPALAAAPATEIPRLLAARPELRLPQALTRPELLRDPDLLVITLAHLQQVLDQGDGPVPVDRRDDHRPRPKLSCKPIGTLMPAPIDLSANRGRHQTQTSYPLLRVRTTGLLKQESEVSSTAASPEDSHLWHPLFGSQKRHLHHNQQYRNYHHCDQPHYQHQQPQRHLQLQHPQSQQQHQHQDQQQQQQPQQQNHSSWHRATMAL